MDTIERTAPAGILIVDGVPISWRAATHEPAPERADRWGRALIAPAQLAAARNTESPDR